MKQKFLYLLFIILTLLCSCEKKPDGNLLPEQVPVIDSGELVVSNPETKGTFTQYGIEAGSWTCKVLDIQVITGAIDIDDDCINARSGILLNGQIHDYPDMLSEDKKSLIDGCSLILVEVEAQNIDAKNSKDEENMYVFSGDGLLYLVSDPEHIQTDHANHINISYFSDCGRLEGGSPLEFELKPGEKKTFKVGFFIGDTFIGESHPLKLSDLYLSGESGWVTENSVQLEEDALDEKTDET